MVIMESRDLLAEVSVFLRVTLADEKLSEHAETRRQQLIRRLREDSPHAYTDMNGGSHVHAKLQKQTSDYYEEFNNCFESNPENKQNHQEGYVNNLYNNLSSLHHENVYSNNDNHDETENCLNIKYQNQYEDNTYIKPTSPLANTPVIPTKHLPKNSPSNSNSERNSIISLKKESPDRISDDSSSFTSTSTKWDESPEVLSLSASALRYAAWKSGNLGRRERILMFDYIKTYWVALLNHTLFMYSTDKDCKPLHELEISGYKARPVAVSNNKTDFKFELVSPGKKTYQFIAEKQSDMEKWICEINSTSKTVDSCKEWGRQLPSPPCDQPDSVVRSASMSSVSSSQHNLLQQELVYFIASKQRNPTVAGEGCITKKVIERHNTGQSTTSSFTHSPKEMRRLPLLPHQQVTYDQPEPIIRPVVGAQPELYECLREELYHCIDEKAEVIQLQKSKETLRRLPSLPLDQEVYDQPEPRIRPVVLPEITTQEEFYSVIDNNTLIDKPVIQEAIYKNLEENDCRDDNEDCNYYNLVPYTETETDQECIYDVITEQRHIDNPSPSCNLPDANIKTPVISVKPPVVNNIEGIKLKLEEKRLSPLVSNMATIFNKPFTKPQLRQVKSPIVNKSYQ